MKKIGILGGTFDPIHIGHIFLAKEALKSFNLDIIYFVPTGISYHKIIKTNTSKKNKLKMIELAIENEKKIIVKKIDIEKEKITYTINTIETLKKEEPNNSFFFILGSDSFLTLKKWKNWKELTKEIIFLIGCRNKNEEFILNIFISKLTSYVKNKIYIIPMKNYNISSSFINKNGIKKNKNYLNKNVYKYILKEGLYKNEIRN